MMLSVCAAGYMESVCSRNLARMQRAASGFFAPPVRELSERRKQKMEWSFVFFANSALLGVGLAMDAFSVSLANGLHEPSMGRGRMAGIAGVFGGFQAAMPLLGWVCVRTVVEWFSAFEQFIPWIALLLLGYIGGKMLIEGLRGGEEAEAVATSIDALSVGFTIAEYGAAMALVCAAIIAAVTFVICMAGLQLGKTFGTRLAGKASVLGGVILIAIGIEIFVTSL